jgi:hypothetical protein
MGVHLAKFFSGVRWSRVIFLLLSATTLLLLSEYVLAPFWQKVTHEIGFALLVSAVVWTLLEAQLRQESDALWDKRIEQATRNVFLSVLRKDLPKPLLDEANNLILSSSLIRTDFAVTYTLRDSSFTMANGEKADCVLVDAVMEFQMRNVSTDVVPWTAGLGLPNPVHPELKKMVGVHSVRIQKGGDEVAIDFEGGRTVFLEELEDNRLTSVSFMVGDVILQPGETCSFSASYVMAKEAEDTELLQTLHPTDGLRVTIFDQSTSGKRVTFARSVHRKPLQVLSEDLAGSARIFTLPGYLLPYQGVLIWWKNNPDPGTTQIAS